MIFWQLLMIFVPNSSRIRSEIILGRRPILGGSGGAQPPHAIILIDFGWILADFLLIFGWFFENSGRISRLSLLSHVGISLLLTTEIYRHFAFSSRNGLTEGLQGSRKACQKRNFATNPTVTTRTPETAQIRRKTGKNETNQNIKNHKNCIFLYFPSNS